MKWILEEPISTLQKIEELVKWILEEPISTLQKSEELVEMDFRRTYQYITKLRKNILLLLAGGK